MSLDAHKRVEGLMSEAELLEAAGFKEQARALYFEAAQSESLAFDLVPTDRVRTRGILAVGVVALYRRADAIAESVRYAHLYLSRTDLPDFALVQLEDALLEIQRERHARASNKTLGRHSLDIVFDGGDARFGIAPLDAFMLKLQQFERYIMRVGEWVANKPFRDRGPVSPDVERLCHLQVTAPIAGSFRFSLRIESPLQLELFVDDSTNHITADTIASASYSVLDSVANDSTEQLAQRIENQQYRIAFLKLVRNLVPDGKDLGTMEVQHTTQYGRSTATLTRQVRHDIDEYLTRGRRRATGPPETIRRGVLRALDLDKRFIVLVEDGEAQKCWAAPGQILDDAVEPLVNKRVRVTGYQPRGRGRRRFIVQDIAEDVD
jgi:hypothetical protein